MFNLSLSFKTTASLSSKSFFSYLPAITNTQISCVGEIYKMRRLHIVKAVFCHLPYLTYMQSTSCEIPDWMKHKLESRWPGEISVSSDMQMTPPLWQKSKRNYRAS